MKVIILFILLSCQLISSGHKSKEHGEDLIIRAAVLNDFPPLYIVNENGKPAGFAIDILENIAARANIHISYIQAANWAQAMQLIRTGNADIIPGIGISASRKREFSFSNEIECIPVSCFVRKHESSIRSVADLNGHRIAVIKQSAAYTTLQKQGILSLVEFNSIDSALFSLLSGEVDAFVFPKPVLEKKARDIGVEKRIKVVGSPIISLKRGFLTTKDNTHLISFLNPYIEELVRSPEYKNLYLKWYGNPNRIIKAKTIFLTMLVILIISSTLLLIWRNRSIASINSKLTEQKNYLNSLKKNTPDAMYLSDMEGNIIDANNESCHILGYSYQQLLSKNIVDIDASIATLKDVQHFWQSMEIGVPQKIEGYHKKKDGTIFPVEINVTCLLINNEKHLLGFARDLTERQQIEEQLRQSQKMQAIGQLAGGIAHDFNNLLSGIIGYTDISLTQVEKESNIYKYLSNIMTAGEHARKLVEQILTFSRSNKEVMKPVNLSSVISESIELLSATIPSSIKIISEFESNTPNIIADSTRINESLMNLVTNSVHAMNDKGKIKISLTTEIIRKPMKLIHNRILPGKYAVISITDTGAGIKNEIIEKIFDPFFTTKPTGKGTGLGLSVVYGIIESHNGYLDLISKLGSGTCFKLYFPESLIIENNKEEVTDNAPKGKEHILFVDDEPLVTEMGTEMLKSLGYKITAINNSTEALKLFIKNKTSFDLIITDQTMPDMTGAELAKKIKEINKNIPIILCTGFSKVINAKIAKEMGIDSFCIKPLRMTTLAHEIRNVLKKA